MRASFFRALTIISLLCITLVDSLYSESNNSINFQFVEIDFSKPIHISSMEGFSTYEIYIENPSIGWNLIEKIGTSCGCTRATSDSERIGPKQKGRIKIEVKNSNIHAFQVARAMITWKSGHVTQLVLAKKDSFGVYVTDTTLSWDAASRATPKEITIYLDSHTFVNNQDIKSSDVIARSTTGAFNASLERVDLNKRCLILSVVPKNLNLTTDIIRFSFPTMTGIREVFFLCKQNNY